MKFLLVFLVFFSGMAWLSAQISVDWKAQATGYVIEGYTTPNPDEYIWHEEFNIFQGVQICVLPSEKIPIYIEQGNNYIDFTTRISPDFAWEFMLNIDVNINGYGWNNLYNGSSKQDVVWFNSSQVFSSLGEYDLQVEIQVNSGQEFYREYTIVVIPPSTRLFKDNYGNTLRLWPSTLPGVNKPVLFSEGFDAYDTNPQQMYYSAAQQLIACLRDQGFDIFLLNNLFGTQDIRNNAAGYSAAVRFVSALSINQPITAGGVSMGGMIARYAHAFAEQQGNPLPVYAFLSVDSPQQGAIVSQPLQDYKKEKTAGNAFAEHALNNPAAKQLLNYCAYDPSGGIHQAFYNELNSLNGNGYPHLSKNIGVSFSTTDPNPAQGEWINILWNLGPFQGEAASFSLTPEERLPGSWLPVDLTTTNPMVMRLSAWYYDFLIQPFNYPVVSVNRTQDPTYISYESALDIVNGQSKFDVTIIPAQTTHHDVLPPEIIGALLNEISFAQQYIQNVSVSGQAAWLGTVLQAGREVNPWMPEGEVLILPGAQATATAIQSIVLEAGFRAYEGSHCLLQVNPALALSCNTLLPNSASPSVAPPPPLGRGDIAFWGEQELLPLAVSRDTRPDQEFRIYPNPVRDRLYISAPHPTGNILTVELYNTRGERVIQLRETTFPVVLHMQPLPPGLYLLRVSQGQSVVTRQVVKQ